MQAPSAPSTGDKVDLKALNGRLLYIRCLKLVENVDTVHGTADAIQCDIAVLDGDEKGTTFDDTLIFPKVLVSQLRPAVGSSDPVVVGRLGQGLAKPGKSAPWTLNTPTDAEMETAAKYEAYAAQKAAEESEPF